MVSRDPERAELLGALLVAATDYDVIVLESVARGYSRIKQMVPDLVVVLLEADDIDACQLLSMLKMDSELCGIRVVTWQTDGREGEFEDILSQPNRDSSRHMVGIQMN